MTKVVSKGNSRRPVNYWSKFNEWWRQVLEESGRRPEAAAINRWYEDNAHEIWPADDMPTMLETRIHAKCLRSVDEVRNYFRAYRAQRRPARGGVSKLVGPTSRQPRPVGQSSAQAGPLHQLPSFSGRVGGAGTVTGIPEGTAHRTWWSHGHHMNSLSSRQSVGAVAGPSVVITGFPHSEIRHRALSHTQPISPVKPDPSVPKVPRSECAPPLAPPGFGVDMAEQYPQQHPPAYGTSGLLRACSNMSTGSLDALLGIPEDDPRDTAGLGAHPALHAAQANA
ncbi:hypothetical protein VOLCADRAFT_119944, partial [Volvox carteri f. nagariensis]